MINKSLLNRRVLCVTEKPRISEGGPPLYVTIDGHRVSNRDTLNANVIYLLLEKNGNRVYDFKKNLTGFNEEYSCESLMDWVSLRSEPVIRDHNICIQEGWGVAKTKSTGHWVAYRERGFDKITFFWQGAEAREVAQMWEEHFYERFEVLHPYAPKEAEAELLALVDGGEDLSSEKGLIITPEGSFT